MRASIQHFLISQVILGYVPLDKPHDNVIRTGRTRAELGGLDSFNGFPVETGFVPNQLGGHTLTNSIQNKSKHTSLPNFNQN